MPVTAIVGAQYGSEGKGAVVARLAHKFDVAIRTGGANAGHSFWHEGRVWKMRQIPCTWINEDCILILGPGAVIDLDVLGAEQLDTGRTAILDEHAIVVRDTHKEWEERNGLGRAIGSTVEGIGAARIAKIERLDEELLIGRYRFAEDSSKWYDVNADHILLEGTQGSGLSLHHGPWPYVTSNDTNVAQLLADAGIAPFHLSHCLLVARTYPIRVGGHSGPMFEEIDWREVPGAPEPELTTVTHRQRRIGKWEPKVFETAVRLNDPCGLVVTFMDYIDPKVQGATDGKHLTGPVFAFIGAVEAEYGVPVVMVGTGGPHFEMVPIKPCKHGEEWA